MEERIKKAVKKALAKAGAPETAFTVERPSASAYGDYATNAALAAAKLLGKNPRDLADEVARIIKDTLDEVERIEVAGPGFINITLSKSAIALAISEAAAQGEEWGRGIDETEKRILVEYANPNPFKEMHIGHLMSAIIGEAITRLTASRGANVFRSSFGGDVGPHVAKALWELQKEGITDIANAREIGQAYARASVAYETDEQVRNEIDALNVRIYNIVAHAGNAKLSSDDQALFSLWQEGREISMQEFRRIFLILGTKLDFDFFDSDTIETGMRVVRDGLKKVIFEESDGAIIYRGEKEGLHTLVFITSRGTPTYETKDIGLAFLKEERFPSDESIVVTSTEQIGHFKVVLAALEELAPLLAAKTKHLAHGLLRLTSGKMSSREGSVITAMSLIEDIIKKANEKNADPLVAEQVAIGAIKYMVLRQSPGSDIIFDAEKSLSLEGDSGPYLQYALVRARKILTYAEGVGGAEVPPAPYAIERIILHFPEVVARAARELAPNLLVNYLTELAAAWNAFYATEQVLGSPEETYKQRVTRAFVHTMENGLTFLGIPAPEKM
ncbi:MAG: arginine--tRNA ligase [Minisyncoccota bacterium]